MTLRLIVLFVLPLFVAFGLGYIVDAAARIASCLAPGVEACAEGRR